MVRTVGKESMRILIAVNFEERGPRSERRRSLLFPSSQPQAATLRPLVSRSNGFTLLELALVIFIIGLLATVILPRFGDFGHARLESSAQRLAALVRYLNGEAAFTGKVYRLSYDLEHQRYAVQVLIPMTARAEFVEDDDPLSQPTQLPAQISFADVRVPSVGRTNSGQVFTHFYPQGYTDPTVVHLRDQQERVMTVMIPPIAGEAMVYEGYVDAAGRRAE